MQVSDIKDVDRLGVKVFNNRPDFPIKEYHGLVFAEDVVDFDEKNYAERLKYMGSSIQNKSLLKQQDYEVPDMLSYDMGGVEIFYPKEGDLSWYNAFPASPDKETATNVEMLGSSINDGFKMKKHYSIDKTQLIPQ